MRQAAQKMVRKGATAMLQKAVESTLQQQQKLQEQRMNTPRPAPGTPPGGMRDLNPAPDYTSAKAPASSAATPANAKAEAETIAAAMDDARPICKTAAEPAPTAEPAPAAEQATAATAPNPAINPAAYAQDMLEKMGIKIDLTASFERGIDLGTLRHPGTATPPPPLPAGARFERGSYANHAGSRNYKLFIPSSYRGQPMPLLVMLHGCTQNPDDFATGTQMNQVAEEAGCLVVYPEQTAGANQSKCWNWFNAIDQQRGQGEPSIIAGIAEQIGNDYAVNPQQVYVAGLSAGGAMAVIVGTLYPELFAAVGVHSGLPFASATDLPSALSAMKRGASNAPRAGNGSRPIIVFHGDSDTTVNPRNGEQVIAQQLDHLDADPDVQSGAVPNGYRYTQTTHTGADGAPLGEHWVVHGAGHAWSGGSEHGSYTDSRGPDASREMLRFFRTVS
ncbi:esterase [Duganella sp. Leaf126]|nr:esterase [Duganella sp. Leaf126]